MAKRKKFKSAEHKKEAQELAQSWDKLVNKYKSRVSNMEPPKRKEYVMPVNPRVAEMRETRSHDSGGGVTPKKESPQYTGDKMIGIGTMHKSNAVPIFKAEDAEDISKMRR